MAATEAAARGLGSVLAAALALPGLAVAQSEPGPGPAVLSLRWLGYRDWQPGLQRVSVQTQALQARVPLGERLGVQGTLVADSVSGASPRYHSAVSGASRLSDRRHAGDVQLTHYGDRSALSLGAAASDENDFHSRAVSVQTRHSSEDNNRSWDLGLGLTRDRIASHDDPDRQRRRRTTEISLALSQALSRSDLVQAGLTQALGRGDYDDPYKRPDLRPTQRDQTIATLRWNHHFEGAGLTLRSSYRHYRDSFGVRSHTLGFEPVLVLGPGFSVTPSLRLYTQRAARFYFDPVYSFIGAPNPPGYPGAPAAPVSADQRLSAFGAVTVGLKLAWSLGGGWSTDVKLERYEQRGAWRVGGTGSPGLAAFSASFWQWGLTRSL